MSGEQISGHPTAPTFDRLENFNYLLSRQDPTVRSRHYSFDADSSCLGPPVTSLNMDYDQTEGMGGLSVSSYDSIDDDRSSIDLRGYPYHGKSYSWDEPIELNLASMCWPWFRTVCHVTYARVPPLLPL